MITPDDFTPVDLLVPPQDILEPALGYETPETHNPRFIAFFWEPAGDEARYADGKIESDANWPAYLEWVRFLPHAAQLEPYDLGSSDGPACHWLILDRDARRCFVATVDVARHFLASQWPAIEREPLDPEQVREFYRRMSEALKQAVANAPIPTMAEIEAAMRRDAERLAELQAWLKVAYARAEFDRLDADPGADVGDVDDPNYVPF